MLKIQAVPTQGAPARRHVAEHLLHLPKVKKATRPVRRRIEREGVTPDGVVVASLKSLTRVDTPDAKAPKHEIKIDLPGGMACCKCENFRFKRSKGGVPVSLRFPQMWCKHIVRALDQCERRGEVEYLYSEGELMEARPTGLSFDEGALLRLRRGGHTAHDYDQEHDDYAAELMEAETGTYSGEVEDDDPLWFERAVAKVGGAYNV